MIIIFTIHANAKDTPNPFLGTWKLISVTRDTVPPSKTTNSFGEQPSGFLNYDDDRMMVIIVQKERPTPQDQFASDTEALALYRTLNSYAGTYTIKDDHIIHHIDISWNQKWTGTDQIRYYQFVDDRLILSLPSTKEEDKIVVDSLTWEKISL